MLSAAHTHITVCLRRVHFVCAYSLVAAEMESIAGNSSNVTVQNSTCNINQEQWRDAIVIVRLVISGLSIGGALSIIITVLVTRTFKKQTIHPLLALSIADLILSLLYVVGGGLWFGKVTMNLGEILTCFLISRLTLITTMASLCTQLIYGALAYLYIKKTAEGITTQPLIRNTEKPAVSCGKVSIAYILAWAIPTILVATPFIGLSVDYATHHGSFRTCWCLPSYMNVIPYTFDKSKEAKKYLKYIAVLHLSTAVPLFVLTSIIFVALISIYLRTWCLIRNKAKALLGPTARNQELQTFITKQRKSFRRIIAFMTYFIILSVLLLLILVGGVVTISKETAEPDAVTKDGLEIFGTIIRVSLLIQAVVVPLQGFVNAVIFGWSRPTFLKDLSQRLRRSPIAPQRQASLRRDYSPVSSGSIGQHYSTLPDRHHDK